MSISFQQEHFSYYSNQQPSGSGLILTASIDELEEIVDLFQDLRKSKFLNIKRHISKQIFLKFNESLKQNYPTARTEEFYERNNCFELKISLQD